MVERLKWDIKMVRVYFRYNLKSYTLFYYVTGFSKKTDEGVLLSSSTAVAWTSMCNPSSLDSYKSPTHSHNWSVRESHSLIFTVNTSFMSSQAGSKGSIVEWMCSYSSSPLLVNVKLMVLLVSCHLVFISLQMFSPPHSVFTLKLWNLFILKLLERLFFYHILI